MAAAYQPVGMSATSAEPRYPTVQCSQQHQLLRAFLFLQAYSRDMDTTDTQQSHCGASQPFGQMESGLLFSSIPSGANRQALLPCRLKCVMGKRFSYYTNHTQKRVPFLYGAGENITWKNSAAILGGACRFHPSCLPSQKDTSSLDIPQISSTCSTQMSFSKNC